MEQSFFEQLINSQLFTKFFFSSGSQNLFPDRVEPNILCLHTYMYPFYSLTFYCFTSPYTSSPYVNKKSFCQKFSSPH
jgi:hypothetical protein